MQFIPLNKKAISIEAGPVGCILIHGFTSNPEEMTELSHFLAERNLTVRAPLLPGHGTVPPDLAKIRWSDWTDEVRKIYFELKSKCQEIFVCGQSMGGTLALHLASHYPVEALVTFAAPVKYERPRLRFLPYIQKFYHYYPKKHGNDIAEPEARRSHQSYPVYPTPSVLEFQKLVRHTYDDLPEISAPILVFHSQKDHTIALENVDMILHRVRSKEGVKIIFEESYHLLTLDLDRKILFERTYEFIQKHSELLKP